MKNLLVVMLFIGVVIVGGVWMMSDDQNGTSGSPDAAEQIFTPSVDDEGLELPVVSQEGPWPKLVAEKKEYDFGTMLVGQRDSHVFTIRNDGDADLELLEGQATCKCTKFRLSKRTLAPGESADLTIEWHAKVMDQTFSHGGPVYTNDPDNREVRFAVSGMVDSAVQLLPAGTWHLDTASLDSEGGGEGFIISRLFDELKIKSLELDSTFLEASTRTPSPEELENLATRPGIKSGLVLRVSFKPDAPPGIVHAQATFELEGVEGQFTVKVSGKKQGPIRIIAPPGTAWNDEKSGLQLGRFPKAKGRETRLNLVVDHTDFAEALKITEVNASPGFMEAVLDDGVDLGENRRRYNLTIRIPAGTQAMSLSPRDPGTLKIKTNHPSGYEVSILVSFIAF